MRRTIFLLTLVLALAGAAQAKIYVLLAEDFEGLPLGPNVDEGTAGTAVWTDVPPDGWINDASGVPGVTDPANDGVTEWAGWGFASKDWWIQTAGDQRRSEFALGQGTVAIADPDEWDDAGHPGPSSADPYDVWLSTAPIDLSSARPGTVQIRFDSSWRPEYDDDYHQTGNLRVSFDGAEPIELFRWESNSTSPNFKNDSSTNETVVVDIPNPAGASSMVLTFGLFDAGNDWWWAIDNLVVTGEWSGIQASNPSPANGAREVDFRTALTWTPGEYAGRSSPQHRILLSDDLGKLSDGTAVVATQDANNYDAAGQLDFSTTYYWRVDEANSVTGWNEGGVWSFTTESLAYPVTPIAVTASSFQPGMTPENTINGSGLNANDEHSAEPTEMWTTTGAKPAWIQFEFDKAYKLHELWVWNSNQLIEAFLGFGARDVTVEYSTDGATWTALEGVSEFAQAPGVATYTANTKANMAQVMAKFVKLTIGSNWGGVAPQTGLSEVRFYHIPVRAREPRPADGATDVSIWTSLDWRAGREAESHEVSFGAGKDALALVDTVTDHSYTPGTLEFATTYFWKVNEIGGGGPYEGELWSFTTQEYAPIDDFESYNDDDNRIYESWIDGLTTGASGSQVGYDAAPFAERTIVHGGKQSMPLRYDNAAAPFLSEAERTFDTAQDWTLSGADTLSLYVRGNAPGAAQPTDNAVEPLYVTLKDSSGKSKTVVNPDPAVTGQVAWQQWKIPLSEFSSAGVKVNAIKSMTIGVGNKAAPAAGGAGTIYIDDIGFGVSVP